MIVQRVSVYFWASSEGPGLTARGTDVQACSRGSRSGTLSGRSIGPMGISRLRLRRTLRLRGSRILRRLWGTGHGRNDRCYRDARRSGLYSANRGFAATICLRTRLLGRRIWLGRIRLAACRVLVALKARVPQTSEARTAERARHDAGPCESLDSLERRSY